MKMEVTRQCGCVERYDVWDELEQKEVDNLQHFKCDACCNEEEVFTIKYARYKRDGSGDLEWYQMSVIGRAKAHSIVYEYNKYGRAEENTAHILER